MPTAILADDEPLLLQHLQQQLQLYWPALQIIAVADNGIAALQLLNSYQPDFAFLDIRMPGLTGLEVAGAAKNCRVVFVTAFDQYAIHAFEHAATDYLLKPVTAQRLALCISRLQQTVAVPQPSSQAPTPPSYLQWLHVGLANQIKLVQISEVMYFRAQDKYTEVVTLHEQHLIRLPLKELIRQLCPNQFCQTHRAFIVRLQAIERIEKDIFGRNLIYLQQRTETIPLSRNFAGQFRQM